MKETDLILDAIKNIEESEQTVETKLADTSRRRKRGRTKSNTTLVAADRRHELKPKVTQQIFFEDLKLK